MTSLYADAAGFRGALLDAGLLIATGADGVYHRAAEFESALLAVDAYTARQRPATPAYDGPVRHLPPVLPRADFLRTDYVRSFPDLVGSVDVFRGDDRAHRALLAALDDGDDWTTHLEPAEVVLASAVCHPVYGTLPASVPEEGFRVECVGTAFRHEPSLDPMRMQSFRMHELVRVGTPAQAIAHRDEWLDRGADALARLGLKVRVEPANDPFFGRVGRMLAANQRESALKFEVLLDVYADRPTAIASANYHEDHFGLPFGITTPDGEHAHSACFGFGLERITLGLFATHGLDSAAWPADVRDALWPGGRGGPAGDVGRPRP